jgi:hypothetical protein
MRNQGNKVNSFVILSASFLFSYFSLFLSLSWLASKQTLDEKHSNSNRSPKNTVNTLVIDHNSDHSNGNNNSNSFDSTSVRPEIEMKHSSNNNKFSSSSSFANTNTQQSAKSRGFDLDFRPNSAPVSTK